MNSVCNKLRMHENLLKDPDMFLDLCLWYVLFSTVLQKFN